MQKFQDVLDGKIKREDLTTEELPEYIKFAQAAAQAEEGKVAGLREAKRVEQERVDKLKKDGDDAEAAAAAARKESAPLDPAMQQFRTEQVTKAKNRLYATLNLSDEDKAKVEEKFKILDTGKLDADLIYTDLLSSVAAAKPDTFLEMSQDRERNDQAAAAEVARQAAMGITPPSDGDKKIYTDEALKLAKDAGITPEAATKQLTQGMKRVIG